MATSLYTYYDRVVYLNLLIYLLYAIVKYLIGLILLFIFQFKFQQTETPIQWIVFYIFGKLLQTKRVKEGETIHIPTIALHSDTKKMSRHGQITLLFVVIVTSVILAVGTALDLSLFGVSHICTEDSRINCYPQLISGANGTGLNISVDEPLQSCTYWNSEGVSERVTFICFDKEFNFDFFLASTGGLLALTLYVLKTATGVLLSLARCCVKTCNSIYRIDSKNKSYTCTSTTCVFVVRIIFAVLASIVEVVLVILCLVLAVEMVSVDSVSDPPSITFLIMHAAEILVIFGITATLLWLPWEDYWYAQAENCEKELKKCAQEVESHTEELESHTEQLYRNVDCIPTEVCT